MITSLAMLYAAGIAMMFVAGHSAYKPESTLNWWILSFLSLFWPATLVLVMVHHWSKRRSG